MGPPPTEPKFTQALAGATVEDEIGVGTGRLDQVGWMMERQE